MLSQWDKVRAASGWELRGGVQADAFERGVALDTLCAAARLHPRVWTPTLNA